MQLLLNCDLGEIDDPTQRVENAVMPFLDMANIACGLHAGSPLSIAKTLQIAARHQVVVGAHPGYGDRDNFGRVSVPHNREELIALFNYQIAAMEGMARHAGLEIAYIKPHGALYNDMMANSEIRHTLLAAMRAHQGTHKLMLLATADAEQHLKEAEKFGIELIFETFADRCYDDNGFLLSRVEPGAVHDQARALQQVQQLCEDCSVTTKSGKVMPIHAQSLCIHGDSPDSVDAIRAIHQIVQRSRG